MLLYVIAAIAVLILLVLAIASTKPSTFVIARTTLIAAPPASIARWIEDFHHWAAWSPWERLDPSMAKTFSGTPSGPGAIYEWSGNKKAGAGRMEILSATSAATDIQLDFFKPFANSMKAHFTFDPVPSGTQVTWTMMGPQKLFPSKVMSVFVSMDKLIGDDFERGLANLKSVAEAAAAVELPPV